VGADRRGRMFQPTYLVIFLGPVKINFMKK
jgi:hypothetical protein